MSGIFATRNNGTNGRNDPYVVELSISGNAPLFLRGSSAADVSVFHFYS